MTKLAIVYPAHYEQSSGGAELQISYLTDWASRSGFEVHLLFVNREAPPAAMKNVVLHPLEAKRYDRFFSYGREIHRELIRIAPDVLYTRHSSSWIWFAARYAQKYHVPHVHALASDKVADMKPSIRQIARPDTLLEYYLLYKGMRHVRHFITQNRLQSEQILASFGKKSTPVSQMTPLFFFDDNGIGKKESPVEIYWVANLKGLKRPEIFIELAKRLAELPLKTEYRLYMCGRAPEIYRRMLAETERDNPRFQYLGELSQEEVNRRLSGGHLLVNTSIYEGFSNTFVQAWMRKVPVVAMNSDPDFTLSRENLGFLAPTMEELVRQTARLIEDAGLRADIGEKAYEYAAKHHALENNMPELLALLKGIGI